MNRDEILEQILALFLREFEIENPGLDDNLRDVHGFDSIDAIEMLLMIEKMLGYELTQDEKKMAMDIRTINHICDYIEWLVKTKPAIVRQIT